MSWQTDTVYLAWEILQVGNDSKANHRLSTEQRMRGMREALTTRTTDEHREAAGLRERSADARRQTQADRLERLREGEAVFVGHAQVHARIAHEVAGIHANDSIRRDQVI